MSDAKDALTKAKDALTEMLAQFTKTPSTLAESNARCIAHDAIFKIDQALSAIPADATQDVVAWAVVSELGGIHKMAVKKESAERKAEKWQEEWPNNKCRVRPLVFGDTALAAPQDAQERETPYWLCCGSLDPSKHDRSCREAQSGHPERRRFGTKSEHAAQPSDNLEGKAEQQTNFRDLAFLAIGKLAIHAGPDVAKELVKQYKEIAGDSEQAQRNDALKQALQTAEAVRLRLSNIYYENIFAGTSPMEGNLDWMQLEGAAKVVAAIRSLQSTEQKGGV